MLYAEVELLGWLLLIYTVPARPSRKRAAVWRALKAIGAVYLRDGVCALPERDDTADALGAIAATVEGLGGEAALIRAAQFDPEQAKSVVTRSRSARAAEYEELTREAERLLDYVHRASEHRAFTRAELTELGSDLDKLERWLDQVRARDYFGAEEAGRIDALLGRCGDAIAASRAVAA